MADGGQAAGWVKRYTSGFVAIAMRVLQVNKAYPPHVGGIETVVAQIAESLAGAHIESRVLVCSECRSGRTEVVRGVTVDRAGILGRALGMPLSAEFVFRLRRMARDADVILLHHPFPLGFLGAETGARNKPVCVWYHSDIVRQRISARLLMPIMRQVLNRAVRIFVSSDSIVRDSALLPAFQSKCVVIPFGIETGHFAADSHRRAAAARIQSQYGRPLILSVGRLVYYKGYEELVAAMQAVDANLLIIGQGPLESRLRRLVRAKNLSQRVHIIGPVGDLAPYYHACDIFVLPSVAASEAFGLVQLEAMACGKPVVNTRLPTAVPEVSRHNETGLTVGAGNIEELAGALRTLCTDSGLREYLGGNARSRVENQYRFSHFAQKVHVELQKAASRDLPNAPRLRAVD